MKRVLVCLLLFGFLSGCEQTDYHMSIEPVSVKGLQNKSKAIVIYYTRTGNTEAAAEAVRDEFDCDLQEIKDLKDRLGITGFIGGMIDVKRNKVAEIKPEALDLSSYELIYVCSPTWGMRLAPAVTTFMNLADFKNKKVFMIVTATGKMVDKTFKTVADEIRAKGGIDAGHLLIKTMSKTQEQIKEETLKLIKNSPVYKLK